MTELAPAEVLLADDQEDVLVALRLLLAEENVRTTVARSAPEVLALVRERRFDAALLDLNYTRANTTGREGLALLRELERLDPDLPVIVMTAYGTVPTAVACMREGARDFIEKPWDNARLVSVMRTQVALGRALRDAARLRAENVRLAAERFAPPLVGSSPAMQQVLRLLAKVAPSDATLLITGEHGTGKEVVARHVHAASKRAANVPSARAHPAKRHAAWTLLGLLVLVWLAPWLGAYPSLWYGLCGAATLSVGAGLWRVCQLIDAPLNTAANLVTALREGNYSLRGPLAGAGGAAWLLMRELNALGAALRSQRQGETETTELLQKVMSEIDTAVLAFDERGHVVLENHAAATLLGRAPGSLTGEPVARLGLRFDLESSGLLRFDDDLPGELGPFELRIQPFRYRGRPHTLLVLTSLARLIRDEERRAQRRIIRVLSHEINNSLAPIKSLAGRLQTLATRLYPDPSPPGAGAAAPPVGADARDDLLTGLAVIERRSEHLGRVMADYAKLARTAEPHFRPIRVRDWVERNARLWPELCVESGLDDPMLSGDEALLDQVLLNLLKNAFEAIAESPPSGAEGRAAAGSEPAVCLSWRVAGRWLSLVVTDRGPGLRGDVDPFLPFVSTKPSGSGVGLALCREVSDAHGGRLELENRGDRSGCRATLTLPLAP